MRTLSSGASFAAALLLAATAAAQVTVTDPAAVQPGVYRLEPNHARVQFAVNHIGFSTWFGDFARPTGTLSLDPKAPAASKLDITIPVANLSTTNTVLDGELKAADWLDAGKYPTITFRSTAVTQTGPGAAKVTGDLTLHGVTRPVTLDVTFRGAGTNPLSRAYTIGFDAKAVLKRSDFGVTKYVPLVGDEVAITISAPFEKTAG